METDSKLTFDEFIENLCSKVCKKVSAPSKLNNCISREQSLTVCKVVILSTSVIALSYGCSAVLLQTKKLTPNINMLFSSSLNTTNYRLKHCSLEVSAIVHIPNFCRN